MKFNPVAIVASRLHQTFKDSSGNAVVEVYSITGMSHRAPVDPGSRQINVGRLTSSSSIPIFAPAFLWQSFGDW
jgi:poly(3-hydroxybutyrate) depolymerase